MPLPPSIAESLERGATVVAASPRAARALQLAYAGEQRAAGRALWPTPPILDWDSWLRELYHEFAFTHPDAPVLLTPLQERALWIRMQLDDARRVVSPESIAALAMHAWALLSAFNAHAARRSPWTVSGELSDAESFRHWAAEFERECVRHRWISASQIASHLAAEPALSSAVTLPPELCLVGFDRITPAQRAWLSALANRNVRITGDAAEPFAIPERQWIAAPDARSEIAACAAWVRDTLIAEPSARLGIIVPHIDQLRGEIDRAFRRALAPSQEDIRQPAALLPYEFSLGLSLAEVPAIRAALLLLRWVAGPLPEAEISWLLLSGFVADSARAPLAIARYDAERRRAALLAPERSLSDCAAALPPTPALHRMRSALASLLQSVSANSLLNQERAPSAWSDLVPHLLDRAGWPGLRPADSVQFQALQRWQRLLDELALLDFDGTQCAWSDFLRVLSAHAAETIFAPESHDAPVQIMGPFESSGQQFDAIWFLGADDTAWPPRARPHPLLPHSIQRQYGMPHHTPEDDWNLAHAVTSRLLASAPRIVFSCAERNNEAELRPSPLIAGLFPPGSAPIPAAPTHLTADLQPTDPIPDDPCSIPWPREQHAGGADVLRRQSACPFQAFAAKRFAARPLDSPGRGLDPAEQGKILHAVLERFFREIRSQEPQSSTRDALLAALQTQQLAPALDAAIDATLAAYASPDPWIQSCLAAEKRRLQTRLTEWLTYESQRAPFAVESYEKPLQDVHIGDLRLNLRADRIDLLADDSRLLIDYKTGDVSPASWRSSRPDEPQLPLYAAYGNVENLSGVVFARIRADDTCFDGRVRDAAGLLLPNLKARNAMVRDPYTTAMRDDWARILAHLAERFLAGDAAVDPRKSDVCRICDFPALCRKAELPLAVSGDEDENEDA